MARDADDRAKRAAADIAQNNARLAWGIRVRSAQLNHDPKFQEMTHFLGSHAHTNRMKKAEAEESATCAESLTQDAVNRILRKSEKAALLVAEDEFELLRGRIEWREAFDTSVERLLAESAFDTDMENMCVADVAKLRCKHLDTAYEWYMHQGRKERSKEREGPAYLRYRDGDPAMAGSMRSGPSYAPRRPPKTARHFLPPALKSMRARSEQKTSASNAARDRDDFLFGQVADLKRPEDRESNASTLQPPGWVWSTQGCGSPPATPGPSLQNPKSAWAALDPEEEGAQGSRRKAGDQGTAPRRAQISEPGRPGTVDGVLGAARAAPHRPGAEQGKPLEATVVVQI